MEDAEVLALGRALDAGFEMEDRLLEEPRVVVDAQGRGWRGWRGRRGRRGPGFCFYIHGVSFCGR